MKSLYSILWVVSFLAACSVTDQSTSSTSKNEEWYESSYNPSTCTDLCYSYRDINYDLHEYFMYTGDPEIADANIEWVDIKTQSSGTAWVKKRADKNCLSSNPDDCLVWCKIEMMEHRAQFYAVKDTSTTTDYVCRRVFYYRGPVSKSPHQLAEVLCVDKRPQIQATLIRRLTELGYYFPQYDQPSSSYLYTQQELENAMRLYEIDNRLCILPYSLEVLQALDISFR